MILLIIVKIFNLLMSNKLIINYQFYHRAFKFYEKCHLSTEKLKTSELVKESNTMLDLIQYSNNYFSQKQKMMDILQNLSTKLKNENIILKNNEEKISNQQNEKKNIEENKEKINLQLSLIKENSDSSNDLNLPDKNNNIEISMVHQGKLEEKEKNICQIENLIDSCTDDLDYIEKKIYRCKNTTKDVIMESGVFEDKSMVFVNKNEEEDNDNDTTDKLKYFKELKNELNSLKTQLENLLELYKTEKQLTELKKIELEKLEKLKKEYNKIKKGKYFR